MLTRDALHHFCRESIRHQIVDIGKIAKVLKVGNIVVAENARFNSPLCFAA
jgi:hypothetical protein